jgi:hypothetical protein
MSAASQGECITLGPNSSHPRLPPQKRLPDKCSVIENLCICLHSPHLPNFCQPAFPLQEAGLQCPDFPMNFGRNVIPPLVLLIVIVLFPLGVNRA